MKTRKEVLRKELNLGGLSPLQFDGIMRAMKEYAAQAIDRCVEVHKQLSEASGENRTESEIYSAMKGFVKNDLK